MLAILTDYLHVLALDGAVVVHVHAKDPEAAVQRARLGFVRAGGQMVEGLVVGEDFLAARLVALELYIF